MSTCVLSHLNYGWGWCRLSGLNPPVKYFTDLSKVVLLLWIFYVFVLSCVCYVFVRVCLYVLCGHLLGKGWPLSSHLSCLTVSLSLSHWYPGSGVVLDCIDSRSLNPYLLLKALLGKNDIKRHSPSILYIYEQSVNWTFFNVFSDKYCRSRYATERCSTLVFAFW